MRSRSFPVGYVVLPLLMLALGAIAYAAASAGDAVAPSSAALVVSDGEGIDPRFVEGERGISPQERLESAAARVVPAGPKGDGAYEEFVSAMASHPYVERVYMARYSRQFPGEKEYRLALGLGAFRRHYRDGVLRTTPRDMLPVVGCGLAMDQVHAMEKVLVNDPEVRRQVDRDVAAAIRR